MAPAEQDTTMLPRTSHTRTTIKRNTRSCRVCQPASRTRSVTMAIHDIGKSSIQTNTWSQSQTLHFFNVDRVLHQDLSYPEPILSEHMSYPPRRLTTPEPKFQCWKLFFTFPEKQSYSVPVDYIADCGCAMLVRCMMKRGKKERKEYCN